MVRPHEVLGCLAAPGIGRDHDWLLSVGGQSSISVRNATAYAPPSLHSLSAPPSLDTRGFVHVVLHGAAMGPHVASNVPAVSYFTAQPGQPVHVFHATCETPVDHSSIRCLTVAGAGSQLVWRITIGGQTAERQFNVGYTAPAVYAVEHVDRLPTDGVHVSVRCSPYA